MSCKEKYNLLPCPFCGSNEIGNLNIQGHGFYCIDCHACSGETELRDFSKEALQQAIKAWNTRH